MAADHLKKIACPHCAKMTQWSTENESRPFCSARCKLIDLGAWADEKHSIPGEAVNPRVQDEDDFE